MRRSLNLHPITLSDNIVQAPGQACVVHAVVACLVLRCCCCRETTSLKLAKLRGCTFVNQYVVIKYLGRGACGRVFLCMDMYDNRLYAVKVSRPGAF